MISIDPDTQAERDNYKLLTGSIIPRPIAFVTTLSEEGVINGAPFSYFNIASSSPPMVSLSIQRSGSKQKDTARNILQQKEFVIHIVDEINVQQVNETAASLSPDKSEIELAQLTTVESTKVSVPGIKQTKVRMECRLEHSLELGDKDMAVNDFLIGKVVQFHIHRDIYKNGRIDHEKLAAVSRLAGAYYAKFGEVFEIERPQ